jgi:uncharacterized protein YacL
MNFAQPRALGIAGFAILGAVLSVLFSPLLLDRLYLSIQDNTLPSEGAIYSTVREFDRVVDVGAAASPMRAERRSRLFEFRSNLGSNPAPSQLKQMAEGSGYRYEPSVKITEQRIEMEPVLSELRNLSIGSVSNVITEGSDQTLYVLRQITRQTGGTVAAPLRGYPQSRAPATLVAMALLGLIIGGGLGSLGMRGWSLGSQAWNRTPIGGRVTILLGVFLGFLASIPFLFIFQGMGLLGPFLMVALMFGFSALGVYTLRSMEQVLPWGAMGGSKRRTGIKVLDTNVLIDGRILDVLKSGFLEGDLYVPEFVVHELQHIADSADPLRRQRGRRGLRLLRSMRAEFQVDVGSKDRYAGNPKEPVDTRLVRLAKAIGGDLVSNDFNLNNVAQVQDVKVLNINDLSLAVRTPILPGEALEVLLQREGQQHGQAVGYLEDGTMVVVEAGSEYIGETRQVNVTQVLQTERGKMIFAEIPSEGDDDMASRRGRGRT